MNEKRASKRSEEIKKGSNWSYVTNIPIERSRIKSSSGGNPTPFRRRDGNDSTVCVRLTWDRLFLPVYWKYADTGNRISQATVKIRACDSW